MVKRLSHGLHSRLVAWEMGEDLDQHGIAGPRLRRCKHAAFHLIPVWLGFLPRKQRPHHGNSCGQHAVPMCLSALEPIGARGGALEYLGSFLAVRPE